MTPIRPPVVLALCQRTRVVGLVVATATGLLEVRRVTLRAATRPTEVERLTRLARALVVGYDATLVVAEPGSPSEAIARQLALPFHPVAVRDAVRQLVGPHQPPTVRSLAQTLIARDPRLGRLVTVLSCDPIRIAETERWRVVLLYAVALATIGLANGTASPSHTQQQQLPV